MVNVSVIVPAYNAEKCIERCVESILRQDYTDLELIVVDDGSKDSTPEILDRLAAADARMKVIHQKNAGVSATRNNAIDVAQGRYIQFLDADDWLTSDSTKLLVRTAEEKEADLVIADFYRVVGENLSRKGNILTDKVLSREEYAEYMMESPADYYYGVLWNKLYRRDLIEKYHIRMDEKVSFCEDFIFNLEYILHCEKICALQVPVYYYVKTEGSLVATNLNPLRILEMKTSVFKYYSKFLKSVLDDEKYQAERLSIAGFLIDAAGDEMTIPMMPGTKKVGDETVTAFFRSDEGNLLTASYYQEKLYQRYLNSVAMKHDLTLEDIRVFAAVRSSSGRCTQKELSDYTGISQLNVLMALQKLQGRRMVALHIVPNNTEAELSCGDDNTVIRDLDDAMKDLLDTCFAGFSDEERQYTSELYRRINVNVRKALGQITEE